jgi:hypothetical protein
LTPDAPSLPTYVPAIRIPLREQVTTHLLDKKDPKSGATITTESDFKNWLACSWGGGDCTEAKGRGAIKTLGTAKAMIASWIEERIVAKEGVWFGNSDTQITIGLRNRPSITIDAPAWVTRFLRSHDPERVVVTSKRGARRH